MRSLALTFLAIGTALFMGCSEKGVTENDEILLIQDLLVDNGELTGWVYSGTSWSAASISELTTFINGAAEIYQRYGFEEAAYQSYDGTIDDGTRTLGIGIYDMGSQANAQDTFDDPDIGLSGATTWTNGAGEEAHYVRHGGLSQVLTFYRSSYFVYLELNYDTEESLDILKQFAINVDGKME